MYQPSIPENSISEAYILVVYFCYKHELLIIHHSNSPRKKENLKFSSAEYIFMKGALLV